LVFARSSQYWFKVRTAESNDYTQFGAAPRRLAKAHGLPADDEDSDLMPLFGIGKGPDGFRENSQAAEGVRDDSTQRINSLSCSDSIPPRDIEGGLGGLASGTLSPWNYRRFAVET
jgi:hypothetical protein